MRKLDIFLALFAFVLTMVVVFDLFGWGTTKPAIIWPQWTSEEFNADERCRMVIARWVPDDVHGRVKMQPAQFQEFYAEVEDCMSRNIVRPK